MQYLLTEDEMGAIRAERDALKSIPCRADLIEGLGNVCKMVATTMIPTKASAYQRESDTPPTTPHGCIHVPHPRGPHWQISYCDLCPVRGICPLPKEYSK